jgi:hypothetical protein
VLADEVARTEDEDLADHVRALLVCEFAAADDYEQTCELVAVIRGSDGGRRMYSAGDTLPAVYAERFRTQIDNERIVYPGAKTTTRRCSTTR